MTDKVIHPHSNRRIRSTLMVSALLLGVAACGSDDDGGADVTVPPAVSAAVTSLASEASDAVTDDTEATTESTDAAGSDTTAAGSASGGGEVVPVSETEFKIDLGSKTTFAPGDYTFDIKNDGQFKHNLIVEGPGIEDKAQSDTFEAGEAGTLDVTLEAGSYELYCGVPTHKGKGMDMTITVA